MIRSGICFLSPKYFLKQYGKLFCTLKLDPYFVNKHCCDIFMHISKYSYSKEWLKWNNKRLILLYESIGWYSTLTSCLLVRSAWALLEPHLTWPQIHLVWRGKERWSALWPSEGRGAAPYLMLLSQVCLIWTHLSSQVSASGPIPQREECVWVF